VARIARRPPQLCLVRPQLSSGGAGTLLQDRERHGCRARAQTDVLVASPEVRYRTTSAPPQVKALLAYWLIRIKQDRYDQDVRCFAMWSSSNPILMSVRLTER
jgi:hypothetical protein